jgi:hypothetical protein
MLSSARCHSKSTNPDVVFRQGPFPQVCKSRYCLATGPIPTGVQIQVLSCARLHSHRCANAGVVLCRAPLTHTGVQIQVLSCSWSHLRCANPRASKYPRPEFRCHYWFFWLFILLPRFEAEGRSIGRSPNNPSCNSMTMHLMASGFPTLFFGKGTN